jgi:hypothetical protein
VLGLVAGAEVMATGEVRRRFFRTPAGTGSRTEVVAEQVIPASQRKRLRTALDAAIGRSTQATADPRGRSPALQTGWAALAGVGQDGGVSV